MAKCYGRTKNLHRCQRQGDWKFFCEEHKWQPVLLCISLLTIAGSLASIYSVFPPSTKAPRDIPLDQCFLGHFIGMAMNTTLGRTGRMSVNIESDKEGKVRVSIKASDGLGGEGTLIGEISANGQLRASGTFAYTTLLGGTSRWKCNLTGVIIGNRLTGNYELTVESEPGTIIKEWEGRPSGNQEVGFDLKKFLPVYTPL